MMITREQIASTYDTIKPYIRETPVIEVDAADFGLASSVRLFLKLELLQHSGSFKPRGAFANLLLRDVPDSGVVAASGGNHGAAVAYAAKCLGVPASIFVPSVASPTKIERIRDYGANLVITGDRYADALEQSEALAESSGAMRVHAFDQRETVLGAGTTGLELSRQRTDIDTLLVSVGGGGLIGGIAAWYAGEVNVIGVEPEGAPTLRDALEAGMPVDAPTGSIAADSLAPQRVGDLMFPIAQRYANQVVIINDDDIRNAQRALWDRLRIVAEPGGAAAFAALLSRKYVPRDGERIAVLVCGGNTTAVDFDR